MHISCVFSVFKIDFTPISRFTFRTIEFTAVPHRLCKPSLPTTKVLADTVGSCTLRGYSSHNLLIERRSCVFWVMGAVLGMLTATCAANCLLALRLMALYRRKKAIVWFIRCFFMLSYEPHS
jgi:hypothetical protein